MASPHSRKPRVHPVQPVLSRVAGLRRSRRDFSQKRLTTHKGHSIVECELLTGTRSAEGIMASGHVNRTKRPNTWLLRPALQRDQSLDNPEPPHMACPFAAAHQVVSYWGETGRASSRRPPDASLEIGRRRNRGADNARRGPTANTIPTIKAVNPSCCRQSAFVDKLFPVKSWSSTCPSRPSRREKWHRPQ